MNKITFELDIAGLNAIMKSGAMQSILNQAANQIASRAGVGYEAIESAHPISFIAIASVRTKTKEAKQKDLKTNTLLKASGSVKI